MDEKEYLALLNAIDNKYAGIQRKMHENMQYYMEYCEKNKYVTPQDWILKYKHF